MDLAKVLAQLRQELDHLNAAIESLEHLQEQVARRSRAPGSDPPGRAAQNPGKLDEPETGRTRTRH